MRNCARFGLFTTTQWARSAHSVALLLMGLSLVACEPPKGKGLPKHVETVREETKPDILTARGIAFANIGDNTRAQQYFAAALQEGADIQTVLPLLLRVCVEDRSYRVALEYAETYLTRDPANHRLRFIVGTLYLTVDNVPAAREHLEEVAVKDPKNAQAQYVMAVLLRDRADDPVTADRYFRAYLEIEPEGEHAPEARASLLKDKERAPVGPQRIQQVQ